MYFLDTNIFLRYLTNDDKQKAICCKALFKKIENKTIEAATSDAIVSEIVYVLESKKENGYGLERDRIKDLLYPLLTLKGLRLNNRSACLQALELYASTKLDFEDALLIAYTEDEKEKQLYSYDSGIDAVKNNTKDRTKGVAPHLKKRLKPFRGSRAIKKKYSGGITTRLII